VIDIDRLHDVINGDLYGRGVGKTYAKCNDVAGMIGVGINNIYCITTHYRDINYILPMLNEVLSDHEMCIIRKDDNKIFLDNGARIFFIAERDMERRLRGCEGGLVYMRHWN